MTKLSVLFHQFFYHMSELFSLFQGNSNSGNILMVYRLNFRVFLFSIVTRNHKVLRDFIFWQLLQTFFNSKYQMLWHCVYAWYICIYVTVYIYLWYISIHLYIVHGPVSIQLCYSLCILTGSPYSIS